MGVVIGAPSQAGAIYDLGPTYPFDIAAMENRNEINPQSGAEIKVTEAMLRAGASVLARYSEASTSWEDGAVEIYQAMERAR